MTGGASVRFLRSVRTTAAANVLTSVASAGTGIILARSLGAAGRGDYAAITAWFGVLLIIGELGQTAATTYFVAHDPQRARDYLATSRTMMVFSGGVTIVSGVLLAPLLAGDRPVVMWGYWLIFATCLASFVGASYIFTLQGSSISRWNLVRVSQPVLFFVGVMVLHTSEGIGLIAALATLSVTIVVQTQLAYMLCRRQRLTGGRARRDLAVPMIRYGLSQLASSVPSTVSLQLDQLVLSLVAAPAELGRYAVAASITRLAVPIVSAVGNVAFPRLASRALDDAGSARLQRLAALTSAGVAITLTLPFAFAAPWLVPLVFGADYTDAVMLIWLLVPGSILLACGQVWGDVLRGLGRPSAVALAQGAAALVTITLLATLLPLIGVAGAALASSAGAAVAVLVMWRAQRALGHRPAGQEKSTELSSGSPQGLDSLP